MGSNCSSLRRNGKKDKEKDEESEDNGPLNERKNSNHSVDSLPYGRSSPPASAKSSHEEPSSQVNGETQITEALPTIYVPSAKEDSNLLGPPSTAASPCPSSQTPSPYTTPSSVKIHPSLSPTGLPDLSSFSEDVRALLIGAKNGELKLPELPKELFVYVCANFNETEPERIELTNNVFPKIRRFFAEKGHSIIFVDMHWGISNDFLDDHCFRELCLDTLKVLRDRNQLIILIILNEESESPPLPRNIVDSDFNNALKNMSEADRELFHKWYVRDENAIPACYVMQPVSKYFPSIISDSKEKRQSGIDEWRKESKQMKVALKDIMTESKESMNTKYMKTILEDEVKTAILGEPSLSKRSLLVQRSLTQIPAKTSDSSFDEILQNRFEKLKVLLDDNIPDSQKLVFQLDWHEDGIKPDSIQEHKQYIEDLSTSVMENLKKLIEGVIEEGAQQESQILNPGIEAKLHLELIRQALACNSHVNSFITHPIVLNQLHTYLSSESRQPFIITAPSGHGKSALVSKAAQEISNWLPNFSVIYRIANVSSESSSEAQILRSICEQCCALYGEHVSLASQLLVDRIATLNLLLGKVCFERPLIIIIDGLDQVGPCQLDWLPNELPTNMKLILTFRDDSAELELLKSRFTDESCFFVVPKLSLNESLDIIENNLSRRNRTLTDAQRQLLSLCVHESQSPLYAQLLGFCASQWHSIKSPDELSIKKTVDGLALNIFSQLEGYVGAPVLRFIIGLLVTNKHGLSDNDMLDLLSNEKTVLDRVFAHNIHISSIRRFPVSIWIRVKKHLEFFLIEKQINKRTIISWKSDLFKNIGLQYLKADQEILNNCRNALINYFESIWSAGKRKSCLVKRQQSIDQMNIGEPLSIERKVEELPYLVLEDDEKAIKGKDDYLLNHEWLYYKCCASDPVTYLEDIELYLSKHNEDKHELELLSKVIRASSYPLRYDGSQILTQLYCRLWQFFQESTNSEKYPKLNTIFTHSSKPFITSLLPLNTQLMNSLNSSNEISSPDKSQNDANIACYTHLFSIKDDNNHLIAISLESDELTVWNIYDEKPVRTLRGISQPRDVKMIDRYRAIVLCNRELKLYNLDTGTLETKLKGVMNQKMPYYGLHDDKYVVALSRNRMYVNMINIMTGDLETTFKVGEDRFLNSLLVSANGKICVCGDETQKPFPLLVWDLANRKLLYDLRIPHHEFITRLSAISNDGHYVVSVCKEMNTSSPNFIIVYDLQSGTLFKKWKPECNSVSIAISTQSGCVMNGVESRHVLVWDLSTGTKKYTLRGHTSPPDVLQATEKGNLFLSYDSTGKDRSIRIWELDSGTCLTVYTPDSQISCCRLSPDGKALVVGLSSSMELYTLLLCKGMSAEEAKSTTVSQYGESERDGQIFDLMKV